MTQEAPPPPPSQPPVAPSGWNQPAPAGPTGTGWVQPAAAAYGPVTGLAKIAGIVILLFALFWGAIGALILFAGGLAKVGSSSSGVANVAQFGDAVGNFIAGFGIVILILAIIELIAGIGILMSKDWARVAGIVYALIFGFGSIFIVLGGVGASNSDVNTGGAGAGTLIFGLVFLIGYIYAIFALGLRWRARIA
jgi:hypothetical protein